MKVNEKGKLYLVPTPIGNLEDITLRAIRVLKEVDIILAEDTRTSLTLLKKYEISTHMESFHKFNEHQRVWQYCDKISQGLTVALITDAGSPGISDPGYLLVRECVERGIEIDALPGATAFVPALTASGLPSDKFLFEGFLPQKKGRQTRFLELANQNCTIILYESPYRLVKTLEQIAEFWGAERGVVVCRELTKKFQEYKRGLPLELAQWYASNEPKGEVVIVVEGNNTNKKEIKKEKNNRGEDCDDSDRGKRRRD